MCSCFRSFSFVDKGSKTREELKEETLSLSVSAQIKDIMVRIVHAGGRIEMYQHAIPASKLIQKYPGMCITRPDVFKSPHESLISADDILLPGHKYFLMRRRAMEKLKQNHLKRGKTKEPTGCNEPMLNSKEVEDCGDISFEESVCSAKDFFVSREGWSSFILKQRVKEKRPFVPPIRKPRPRPCRELEWEPTLTSIQELSP